MVNGQGIREAFPTKEEAETQAAQIRLMVENEGAAAFTLPSDIRAIAAKCIEKLAHFGATLDESVDHYIEHVLKYRNAPTVSEIIEREAMWRCLRRELSCTNELAVRPVLVLDPSSAGDLCKWQRLSEVALRSGQVSDNAQPFW
jgi:hypothetical protein